MNVVPKAQPPISRESGDGVFAVTLPHFRQIRQAKPFGTVSGPPT